MMLDVGPGAVDRVSTPTDQWIQLSAGLSRESWIAALAAARESPVRQPVPDDRALRGLKFSAALPEEVARSVLAERLADGHGSRAIMAEPVRWELAEGL
jgi:ATP-dependent Lhr-like helicase